MENELSKIKIPIPFGELLKNSQYKGQIAKMLRAKHENVVVLNLSDDHPLIMLGPMVEEQRKKDEGEVPPFFLSLNIHDLILHNAMFD